MMLTPLKFAILPLSVLFVLSSACKKDEEPIDNATDFNDFLEDEADLENIPALSVVIFNNDFITYEKYTGESNIAAGTALQSNDLFLAASISKTITATALLQLHEDGLFGLDDPINPHLPFQVNVPNTSNSITFRMLLTHTSGIADGPALDGQYYYGQDSPIALGDFLNDYLVPGGQHYDAAQNYHDFEPGTEHEYSNVGNALIGLLVQEISGVEFNAYCKQNIFIPMGMTNTFWRLDEINQTIVTPYNFSGGNYQEVQHYTFTDYPNGGLRTTAVDLFRLLSAFAQGGTYNGFELLSSSTVAQVITPQIPSIDNEVGLHMFIMDSEFGLWGHDGGEEGVATIMAYNPTTKVGAIVLANQGDAELEYILNEAYRFGLEL